MNTFSIVARDPATGEMGVAVQSHWFAVGQIVPWAEAGVGAVATQSFVDPSYGKLGLDLLRAGKSAPDDAARAARRRRRVRSAAGRHRRCERRRGDVHRRATSSRRAASQRRQRARRSSAVPRAARCSVGRDFAVQANLMANDSVWPAMAKAYAESKGDLADAHARRARCRAGGGGDIRGKQSAALIVVNAKSNGTPMAGPLLRPARRRAPQPLAELRRLVALQRAYNHMNAGDLAVEHKDNEAALREYSAAEKHRRDHARHPAEPPRGDDLLARRGAGEHEAHRRSAPAFRARVRDGAVVARAHAAPGEVGTASGELICGSWCGAVVGIRSPLRGGIGVWAFATREACRTCAKSQTPDTPAKRTPANRSAAPAPAISLRAWSKGNRCPLIVTPPLWKPVENRLKM